LIVVIAANTKVLAQKPQEISVERKHAIDSLALEKIRDLSKYMTIIGSKDTPFSEANRVVDRANELFATDSKIGVSSLNSKEVKYYGVKEYFKRLMVLNYDKVKIEWYQIHYISDLELQPDGKYVGIITIYQRFEGSTKEGLVYSDVTKKDITVYVQKKQTQVSGRIVDFWDVMLGDTRVTETKKQ
jgi:hypothetical protein